MKIWFHGKLDAKTLEILELKEADAEKVPAEIRERSKPKRGRVKLPKAA